MGGGGGGIREGGKGEGGGHCLVSVHISYKLESCTLSWQYYLG